MPVIPILSIGFVIDPTMAEAILVANDEISAEEWSRHLDSSRRNFAFSIVGDILCNHELNYMHCPEFSGQTVCLPEVCEYYGYHMCDLEDVDRHYKTEELLFLCLDHSPMLTKQRAAYETIDDIVAEIKRKLMPLAPVLPANYDFGKQIRLISGVANINV